MEKLSEGAESIIEIIDQKTLQKTRLPKTYRNSELDLKLRKFRTKREFKILNKLKENNVNVPKTNDINLDNTSFTFEYLNGKILKESLSKELLIKTIKEIAKMHKFGVTHGDLTTLNMLNVDNEVYIIDFGLSEFSENIEERGVDLNLFFLCIENEHNEFFHMKSELIEIYKNEIENGVEVIKRLENIEKRGRNKNK